MNKVETRIFCEGFHDRAFWRGIVEHLGWVDARPSREDGSRGDATDPWGRKVVGRGQFAFAREGRFLRISPSGNGISGLRVEAKKIGEQSKTRSIDHALVSWDSDVIAPGPRPDAAAQLVSWFAPGEPHKLEGNIIVLEVGPRLVPIVWASDSTESHLPHKQTLERLVCAAVARAYPHRGPVVSAWLQSAGAPLDSHKAWSWSHMAGWYGDSGCDDFFRALWDDGAIRAALIAELEAIGAWPMIVAAIG